MGCKQDIRSVCDEFVDRGLPNYPSGYPFTYWEQYINLRFYLMLALLSVLTTTFLVLTITLMNPWLAAVLVSASWRQGRGEGGDGHFCGGCNLATGAG